MKKFQFGISLVEVLISVTFLGILILIIANIPQSIRLVGSSRHESLAKDIVVQEVERLRATTYDGLALGNSTVVDGRLSQLPAATSQVVITNCPITVCTNGELAKVADVKVSWMEQDNRVRNVQVVTLIAKGGLL